MPRTDNDNEWLLMIVDDKMLLTLIIFLPRMSAIDNIPWVPSWK